MQSIDNSSAGRAAGYDRVVLQSADGSQRTLSRKEFEALPLRERVRYLIEGSAQFFRGETPVAAGDAMKA